MSRRLSIPPVFDDAGLHALERTINSPVDGDLVVLAGATTVFSPYSIAGLRAMIDAERHRGERVTLNSCRARQCREIRGLHGGRMSHCDPKEEIPPSKRAPLDERRTTDRRRRRRPCGQRRRLMSRVHPAGAGTA